MSNIARGFFITAIGYGILGMLLGLHMAMTNDHGQRPTHAHILVIGWVSFFLFGMFYLHFGKMVSRTLARVHFWMAEVALAGIVVGLWLIYEGKPQYEPIAAVSAITYALSFVVFAVVAIPALQAQTE